jgi:hypothetical protein
MLASASLFTAATRETRFRPEIDFDDDEDCDDFEDDDGQVVVDDDEIDEYGKITQSVSSSMVLGGQRITLQARTMCELESRNCTVWDDGSVFMTPSTRRRAKLPCGRQKLLTWRDCDEAEVEEYVVHSKPLNQLAQSLSATCSAPIRPLDVLLVVASLLAKPFEGVLVAHGYSKKDDWASEVKSSILRCGGIDTGVATEEASDDDSDSVSAIYESSDEDGE